MSFTDFVSADLAYLLLVIGLWAGITAVYVPGTGIPEAIAFVGVGLSFMMMLSLPTNWIAVLVLIVGSTVFFVMPFFNRRFARFAEVGLVLQVGGALFMFGSGESVHPVWIVLMAVISVVYNRFVLIPVLKAQDELPETGDEKLVGQMGRVTAPITPPATGAVQAAGELWTARSSEPHAEGDIVIITERDGLYVTVERAKRKRLPVNGTEIETEF